MTEPDFHQLLTGTRMDAIDNAPDHARIMEKILAEALAGLVGHGLCSFIFAS